MTRVLRTFLVGLVVSLGASNTSAGVKHKDTVWFSDLPLCQGVFWTDCAGTKEISGRQYVGEFKNDRKHGKGIVTCCGDYKEEGYFRNGAFWEASKLVPVDKDKSWGAASNLKANKIEKKLASRDEVSVFMAASDEDVCKTFETFQDKGWRYAALTWKAEMERRRITCIHGQAANTLENFAKTVKFSDFNDKTLCKNIELYDNSGAKLEAERRGLSCGVSKTTPASKFETSSKTVDEDEIGGNCTNFHLGGHGKDLGRCSDRTICIGAVKFSATGGKMTWETGKYGFLTQEAKRRGLSCGVDETSSSIQIATTTPSSNSDFSNWSNSEICGGASFNGKWEIRPSYQNHVQEAKRRGLTCGVGEKDKIIPEISEKDKIILEIKRVIGGSLVMESFYNRWKPMSDDAFCREVTIFDDLDGRRKWKKYKYSVGRKLLQEKIAESRGLTCNVNLPYFIAYSRAQLCSLLPENSSENMSSKSAIDHALLDEAKRRGLTCGVGEATQTASVPKAKPKVTSAALTAAQRKAEKLEQELAALKAKQQQQKQTISNDTKLPTITIASVNTKGKQGIVKGRVNDNTGIAEVTVDGTVIPITSNGNFEYSTFVPSGGLNLKIQATDLAGLTSMMSVTLERNAGTATAAINFDRLNPTVGKRVKTNKDALALIVGVADYENTPAKAIFADADAMMFRDYASEKLGIPESRIKTLVNDGADERELLLSVKSWLARASKQGKSDVYVFFAGHGLASDNGEKMYLLPYDGSPELLEKTAILRQELFDDIASANPRSVTVFLDTCYSGTTRGTDMLIASRPIAIKALEQSIPDKFTVFTAARGDQTAKPLEEAKHGMFSYFLMKGMEGEADKNRDNKITAGELHSYVQQNVVQQSSGSQTPELQGDAERVLVRFK